MNSFLNENLQLFKKRFPVLEQNISKNINSLMELETAKNGSPTAKLNGIMLHSKYNPEREADSLIAKFDDTGKDTAVFAGAGLGYGIIEFAKKFPKVRIILIEKDPSIFFTGLTVLDWKPVFSCPQLITLLDASLEDVSQIISTCKAEKTEVFFTKAQISNDEKYYESVLEIIKQNQQKDEINTNTLEKFARLWTSNSLRNIDFLATCSGISKYSNLAGDIPFVILAAGPSLKHILPHLAEIKKRAVTVCVDTALHACLKQNVEPDFIILTDPQYYCSLHLEFLSSPSSILITEVAAYPSVLRFNCRETVLFSSLFPIGQYFEKRTDIKGKLAAGGSVTTSAWDFARFCGAHEIFVAGMDLGFPGKETHVRGSKFEEKAHCISGRLQPSETMSSASLFSAYPTVAEDYNGNKIITDRKMSLFSWWFENQCTKASAQGINTWTLTPESRKVTGIEKFNLEKFLLLPELTLEKEKFFSDSKVRENPPIGIEKFKAVKKEFSDSIDFLIHTAKKGIEIASKAAGDRIHLGSYLPKLDEIDKAIMTSSAKDAASLVFPTQRQLEKLSASIPNKTELEKQMFPVLYSKLIYRQILEALTCISENL